MFTFVSQPLNSIYEYIAAALSFILLRKGKSKCMEAPKCEKRKISKIRSKQRASSMLRERSQSLIIKKCFENVSNAFQLPSDVDKSTTNRPKTSEQRFVNIYLFSIKITLLIILSQLKDIIILFLIVRKKLKYIIISTNGQVCYKL